MLSKAEEEQVSGLAQHVDTVHLGQSDAWWPILEELGRLTHAETPLSYGVETAEAGAELSWFRWSKPHELGMRGRALINASYARSGRWGLYRPLEVEARQRNRALLLHDLTADPRPMLLAEGFLQFNLHQHDQLRVLLTDGSTLLAWVGVFRPDDEPFGPREKAILSRLVPSLLRRVKLEAELASAPLASAGLDVALEALGRAAAVVDARGHLVLMNSLARAGRAVNPAAFDDAARQAQAGRSDEWERKPLVTPGLSDHSLLIGRPRAGAPAPELAHRKTAWGLSDREAEVLTLLAQGLSNRVIAAQLGCAERTIEVHVARVLAKSETEGRAALVARVWRTPR